MRLLFSLFVVVLSLSLSLCAPPTKPVWPTQFDTVFGLVNSKLSPPIVNETSHFYYHYENDLHAQLIEYPERCISVPLMADDKHPCKLYFNKNGTYLSQPSKGKNCCFLIPTVGPVPPEFLKGFDWNASDVLAVDYYNEPHQCNYWAGSGFGYWTDMKTDFDIYFNDGGTGNFWLWGNFNVVPQSTSIFELPGGSECQKLCLFSEEEKSHQAALHRQLSIIEEVAQSDPMIALALHHHKQAFMATKHH